MAIWFGIDGGMRLKRAASTEDLYVYVETADVDANVRRFSVDRINGALITGDKVSFRRVDDNGLNVTDLLEFVSVDGWDDGVKHPDGQWFVHVDTIGGVRLYDKWEDAIRGGSANAISLDAITERMRVRILLVEGEERCLAQTTKWELNTDREVADITNLGDSFRKNKATLISGSGMIECFFDGALDADEGDIDQERSVYLHQLVLRQEIGSQFIGVFLLKRSGTMPVTIKETNRDKELFYLCECIVTSVASAVTTEGLIQSSVQFVTTGAIQLLYDFPAEYLLQETPGVADRVLQESDFGIVLETIDD